MAYQPKSYRKFLATGVATAVVATAFAPAASANFTDVSEGVWYEDAVNYGIDNDLFEGFPGGEFRPNANMTRAEAVTVILRALGEEIPEETATSSYPDVAADAWFAPAIEMATEMNIIQGNPDGTFAPNANLTRAAFAEMFYNAFDLQADEDNMIEYTDTVDGVWYEEPIEALSSLGILQGDGDGTFRPNDDILRSEASVVTHRVLEPTERIGHDEEEEDQVVESVSAITATVAAGTTQQQFLGFEVNGGDIDVDDLEDMGWEVTFNSNQNVFAGASTSSTTGLIRTNLNAGYTFNYQVTLTHEDGEEITSNTQRVQVRSTTDAATQLDDVDVTVDDVVLNSNVVSTHDNNVMIDTVLFENARGNKVRVGSFENVELSSSNTRVAQVNNETGAITAISPGTVTITAERDGVEYTFDLEITNERRQVSEVVTETDEIKLFNRNTDGWDVTFEAFDQFGDKYTNDSSLSVNDAVNINNYPLSRVTGLTQVDDGVYSFNAQGRTVRTGEGEIEINRGNTTLASIPFATSDDGDVEYRQLSGTSEMDRNPLLALQEGTVNYFEYNEGGYRVGKANLSDYNVTSTNTDLFTVDVVGNDINLDVVDGTATGDAQVRILDGSILQDAHDVTVADTTPRVTAVEMDDVDVNVPTKVGLYEIADELDFSIDGEIPPNHDIYMELNSDGHVEVWLAEYPEEGGAPDPVVKFGYFEVYDNTGQDFDEDITFVDNVIDGQFSITKDGAAFAPEDEGEIVVAFVRNDFDSSVTAETAIIDIDIPEDVYTDILDEEIGDGEFVYYVTRDTKLADGGNYGNANFILIEDNATLDLNGNTVKRVIVESNGNTIKSESAATITDLIVRDTVNDLDIEGYEINDDGDLVLDDGTTYITITSATIEGGGSNSINLYGNVEFKNTTFSASSPVSIVNRALTDANGDEVFGTQSLGDIKINTNANLNLSQNITVDNVANEEGFEGVTDFDVSVKDADGEEVDDNEFDEGDDVVFTFTNAKAGGEDFSGDTTAFFSGTFTEYGETEGGALSGTMALSFDDGEAEYTLSDLEEGEYTFNVNIGNGTEAVTFTVGDTPSEATLEAPAFDGNVMRFNLETDASDVEYAELSDEDFLSTLTYQLKNVGRTDEDDLAVFDSSGKITGVLTTVTGDTVEWITDNIDSYTLASVNEVTDISYEEFQAMIKERFKSEHPDLSSKYDELTAEVVDGELVVTFPDNFLKWPALHGYEENNYNVTAHLDHSSLADKLGTDSVNVSSEGTTSFKITLQGESGGNVDTDVTVVLTKEN